MDQYAAIGRQDGNVIAGGQDNIAIGHNAIEGLMVGHANVAIGYQQMPAIIGGQGNIAIGYGALDDMPFMAVRGRRIRWYALRALCPQTDDVNKFRNNLIGISKCYLRKNMYKLAKLLLMGGPSRFKCIRLLVNICGRCVAVDKTFSLIYDQYMDSIFRFESKQRRMIGCILLSMVPHVTNYRYILNEMNPPGITDSYNCDIYLHDAVINSLINVITNNTTAVVINDNYEIIRIMLNHRPEMIGNVLIEYLSCITGNAIDLVYKFINANSVKNIVTSELNKHIVMYEHSPRAYKLVRALATYGYDMKSLNNEFEQSATLSIPRSSSTRILARMF